MKTQSLAKVYSGLNKYTVSLQQAIIILVPSHTPLINNICNLETLSLCKSNF